MGDEAQDARLDGLEKSLDRHENACEKSREEVRKTHVEIFTRLRRIEIMVAVIVAVEFADKTGLIAALIQ